MGGFGASLPACKGTCCIYTGMQAPAPKSPSKITCMKHSKPWVGMCSGQGNHISVQGEVGSGGAEREGNGW